MLVSVDTGHLEDVIRGIHRLLDLRGKFEDVEVLALLVRAFAEGVPDADADSAARWAFIEVLISKRTCGH